MWKSDRGKLEQNLSRLFGECYLLLCQVKKINLVLQYRTRASKWKRSGRAFEGRFGIVCPNGGTGIDKLSNTLNL